MSSNRPHKGNEKEKEKIEITNKERAPLTKIKTGKETLIRVWVGGKNNIIYATE